MYEPKLLDRILQALIGAVLVFAIGIVGVTFAIALATASLTH